MAGDVLGAGAAVALVLAAGDRRLHPRAALDPERAGALRAVELVRRQRQQVDAERTHVDRDLSRRLHGVGVHQRAVLVRNGRQLADWLNRSDLVVGVHHRHQRRLRGHGLPQPRGRDNARVVNGEERGAPAAARQRPQGVQHRFMLEGAGDQVLAPGRFTGLRNAADGEVVRFGAAGGEDHLRRVAIDQRRDRRPCLVNDGLCLLPEMMDAGGVPERVPGDPDDRLHDLGRQRGRGVVVEVDTHGETFIVSSR